MKNNKNPSLNPRTKKQLTAKKTGAHEGQVNVCCHYVDYRYWGIRSQLTDALKKRLEEEAEERAQACIIEGYHRGELNCVNDDEEIRGWWEIAAS